MARPECALSLELEQRMNIFVRVGTIKEHILYGGALDKSDDKRRKDSFGLDKCHKDMSIHFSKLLKRAIQEKNWALAEQVDKEIDEFNLKYFSKRKELQEKELYFEELDDQLREWLLNYISTCLEKNRDENSRIDLQLIKENLAKKKKKTINK